MCKDRRNYCVHLGKKVIIHDVLNQASKNKTKHKCKTLANGFLSSALHPVSSLRRQVRVDLGVDLVIWEPRSTG